MEPSDYHPLDPAVRENPYPYYAVLRREAPVHRVPGLGFWAVSRYDDVATVMRRTDLFSSSPMRAAVLRARDPERTQSDDPDYREPDTLIGSDPPVHTRLRKIANRGFTPGRVAVLEPRIREIAEALVRSFASRGSCDLVADLASPLPVTVIAELLGVDPKRFGDFKRWSDTMVRAAFDDVGDAEAREVAGYEDMLDGYFSEMIEARRRRPTGDLVSALVQTQGVDGAFTDEEVGNLIGTLLVAGNVTTTHLIANAMLALLAHPGELARVTAEPSLVPNLVEEALRYDGPVHLLLRAATEEVELAGVKIPKDAAVAPLFASANRDERAFPEPDRFDVTRRKTGQLAFGLGAHFCLGAPLARLEARIAFEVLLARVRNPVFAEERVAWVNSLIFRGPKQLRLEFDPAR